MKELQGHRVSADNDAVRIFAEDEPGPDNRYWHYRILTGISGDAYKTTDLRFPRIAPQHISANKDTLTDEVLFSILLDRLNDFQKGQLKNKDKANALIYLESAYRWYIGRGKKAEVSLTADKSTTKKVARASKKKGK